MSSHATNYDALTCLTGEPCSTRSGCYCRNCTLYAHRHDPEHPALLGSASDPAAAEVCGCIAPTPADDQGVDTNEARGTGPNRYPNPHSAGAWHGLRPDDYLQDGHCESCGDALVPAPNGGLHCPDCDSEPNVEPDGCPVCGEEYDYDCNGNPRCPACDPPCPCCHNGSCGDSEGDLGPCPDCGDAIALGRDGEPYCPACNPPTHDEETDPDEVPQDVECHDAGPGSCAWCGRHLPMFRYTSGGRHISSPYVTARLRAFCCWSCHQSYHS
jgi:hypothetical protein